MKEKSKFNYFERFINLLNALDGSVVNGRFTYVVSCDDTNMNVYGKSSDLMHLYLLLCNNAPKFRFYLRSTDKLSNYLLIVCD